MFGDEEEGSDSLPYDDSLDANVVGRFDFDGNEQIVRQ